MSRPSAALRGCLLLAAVLGGGPLLFAQVPEVQESSGYVEVLLPASGWRQAVVGRQLPAGSVVTAWRDGKATVDCGGNALIIGPLTHLRVQSLDVSTMALSLSEGSISLTSAAGVFEISYRGMQIRAEKAVLRLSNGTLTVDAGLVTVSEPRTPSRVVPPGSTLSLLERGAGPVFNGGPSPR